LLCRTRDERVGGMSGAVGVLGRGGETPAGAPLRPVLQVTVAALAMTGAGLAVLVLAGSGGAGRLPRTYPQAGEELEAAAQRVAAPRGEPRLVQQLTARLRGTGEGGDGVLELGYLVLTAHPRGAAGSRWVPARAAMGAGTEDADLVLEAHRWLQQHLEHPRVGAALVPEEFALSDLQRAHEAVTGRPLDKRNFRKAQLGSGHLLATPRLRRDGAHRPARLYRFAGPKGEQQGSGAQSGAARGKSACSPPLSAP
jgi:8-oxo-dGTP diphosphatase